MQTNTFKSFIFHTYAKSGEGVVGLFAKFQQVPNRTRSRGSSLKISMSG
jgi:hypothetical protein